MVRKLLLTIIIASVMVVQAVEIHAQESSVYFSQSVTAESLIETYGALGKANREVGAYILYGTAAAFSGLALGGSDSVAIGLTSGAIIGSIGYLMHSGLIQDANEVISREYNKAHGINSASFFTDKSSAGSILELSGIIAQNERLAAAYILYLDGALMLLPGIVEPETLPASILLAGTFAGLGALFHSGIIMSTAEKETISYLQKEKTLNSEEEKEMSAREGLQKLIDEERAGIMVAGGLFFFEGLMFTALGSDEPAIMGMGLATMAGGAAMALFGKGPLEIMMSDYYASKDKGINQLSSSLILGKDSVGMKLGYQF